MFPSGHTIEVADLVISNAMSLRAKPFRLLTLLFSLVTIAGLFFPLPAMAGLTDDRYDGDIFALYAGNGSLVPPKITLADSLKQKNRLY